MRFKNKLSPPGHLNNKFFSFDRSIHKMMAALNHIPFLEIIDTEMLLDLIRDNWVSTGYTSPLEQCDFIRRAYNMLCTYIDNPKDIGADNLIIDKIIKLKTENNSIITGKIDKVYEHHSSELEVVDYKTGKIISQKLDFQKNHQLPLYLQLVYSKLGLYPKYLSYYYLFYNKKYTYTVTKEDIELSKKILEETITKIETEKNFTCKRNPFCEKNCEFYQKCKIENERRENNEQ